LPETRMDSGFQRRATIKKGGERERTQCKVLKHHNRLHPALDVVEKKL